MTNDDALDSWHKREFGFGRLSGGRGQGYLQKNISPGQTDSTCIEREVLLAAETDAAGLPISYTLGLRRNFCCWGPTSNLRPVLDLLLKTTQSMLLDFFVRPQNILVWLVAGFWYFSVVFRQNIGPLRSNLVFTEFELLYAHYLRITRLWQQIFDSFLKKGCFVLY